MRLRDNLLDVYNRMLDRYGPQRWWPGDTPFEVMVGAILTQAAAWTNVEKAIANLAAEDALSPEGIRRLDQDQLAKLVYPSGYYNAKARKLKALVEYLGTRFNDDLDRMSEVDTASLRSELLDVYGIGEETADDILLYALGKPAFVIDSYTRRVFYRLRLARGKGPYSTYQALFEDNLPADPPLFNEFHALIDHHSSKVCRPKPLCEECCLLDICPTGLGAA